MKKVFSYLFVGAIFYFLLSRVTAEWGTIKNLSWNFTPLSLALIILFSILINLTNASTWHVISKGLGSNTSLFTNMKVWIYSNIARFLPGGIWQYPTRMIMSKNSGASSGISGSALVLESVFNIGVGLFIALLLARSLLRGNDAFLIVIGLAILAALLLFTSKKFTGSLLRLFKKIFKNDFSKEPFSLNFKYIPLIVVLISLQFILAGTVLFLLAQSLVDLTPNVFLDFVPIYTISWLLGYLTVFAPAGLGVQELSISTLLNPYLSVSAAAIVAILFRLSLLTGEIFTLVLISLFK